MPAEPESSVWPAPAVDTRRTAYAARFPDLSGAPPIGWLILGSMRSRKSKGLPSQARTGGRQEAAQENAPYRQRPIKGINTNVSSFFGIDCLQSELRLIHTAFAIST